MILLLTVFVAVAAGTVFAWRLRFQQAAVDWLIRKGKLRAFTSGEKAYQVGLADSGKLLAVERDLGRQNKEQFDVARDRFRDAMEQVSKGRKASDMRKYAKAWINDLDNGPVTERSSS